MLHHLTSGLALAAFILTESVSGHAFHYRRDVMIKGRPECDALSRKPSQSWEGFPFPQLPVCYDYLLACFNCRRPLLV